jgi:hypothetical protein
MIASINQENMPSVMIFNGKETSLIIGLIIKFAIARTPPEIKRILKLSE